ncbi:hypothetical protein GM418_29740 [Maribellus comscasis]|uniref:FAD-dependent urate hydroxylase HpyO/Asp monooxygenase CreE-like FAD/NAD(P)-binding domain-containing protein n=1 Tax=Maribellus comscasis TaxID=2681766 RepID=A0A6I6K4U3_9BACT|nr:FAD/NAD(P)-binding protein [Maribellus comscasis]QGY47697.1 hypothetical protein GM418_29740 [Maribellus comscasis]
MKTKRSLAIVGLGPRGLYSLERFIFHLSDKNDLESVKLLLFEKTDCIGNGPVYDIRQPESNWLNISGRMLTLPARKQMKRFIDILPFPSYLDWSGKNLTNLSKEEPDIYPSRSKIGHYLQQRFQSLLEPLQDAGIVSFYNEEVLEVSLKGKRVIIKTKNKNCFNVDEVLLTIGHQPTKNSKQIEEWKEFSKLNNSVKVYTKPYPLAQFINSEQLNKKSTVSIRGFGLAMIDVVRAIAEKFGNFIVEDETTKSLKYQTSSDISDLLFPFSLDGLPMAAKPLNSKIDTYYKPNDKQINTFENIIGNKKIQKEATGPLFLIDAIAEIGSQIYPTLPQIIRSYDSSPKNLKKIIIKWLENEEYEHPLITPRDQAPEKSMHDYTRMATDTGPVSLDFCLGQVWRHCQPGIYDQLSYNDCSDEVFAEIISLDERMKRYAFGPPVESIQQLLALVAANVLNLNLLDNPEIELTEKGWKLSKKEKTTISEIMINSVLDSPSLKKVDSPVIRNLLSNDLIQAVHDDLSVYTDENGYVISKIKDKKLPIAILGRLAKGTIIGVDAILECFGKRPDQWAKAAANCHKGWVKKYKN